MISDLSSNDGGEFECGLCIAGAGAAGLSIALQHLEAPRGTVVVLEAGEMSPSGQSQSHYQGELAGYPYYPLETARLRCFGGSTQHWGGVCRPMEPVAFETRDWLGDSGWPIEPQVLAPYRRRAHEILELGEVNYGLSALPPDQGEVLPFEPERIEHTVWRYSPPTRFNDRYEETFRQARGVEVLLNATLVDVGLSDDTSRVEVFEAMGPDGKRVRVRAKAFVLALGGLETPRLMLNVTRQLPRGLGNEHDLVGRTFMEHPHVPCATFALEQTIREGGAYRHYSERPDPAPLPGLMPSPAVQREHEVLNTAFLLHLRGTREVSRGYEGLRTAARGAAKFDGDALRDGLGAAVRDLDGLTSGLYNRLTSRVTYPPQTSEVLCQSEQAPNPDSRVRLVNERDALGLQRIALDWRFLEIDKRSIRAGVEVLAQEIGRMGLGRVKLAEWLENDDPHDWGEAMEGGFHHMGTTRMADDPRRGVVDRHCRVHGVANLYVAGSGVFPASGTANPTLTVVELALRLSDRLKALVT